jgi:hypothetical protein
MQKMPAGVVVESGDCYGGIEAGSVKMEAAMQ